MTIPTLFVVVSTIVSGFTAAPPCELDGLWTVEEGEGVLRFLAPDTLGRIHAEVVEPPNDDVEPGFVMIRELVWNADEDRYDGRLARSEDSTLGAEVRCLDEDRIEVKGKIGFISRSFRWVRTDVAPPGGAPQRNVYVPAPERHSPP